jgi:hypothetical protein
VCPAVSRGNDQGAPPASRSLGGHHSLTALLWKQSFQSSLTPPAACTPQVGNSGSSSTALRALRSS